MATLAGGPVHSVRDGIRQNLNRRRDRQVRQPYLFWAHLRAPLRFVVLITALIGMLIVWLLTRRSANLYGTECHRNSMKIRHLRAG